MLVAAGDHAVMFIGFNPACQGMLGLMFPVKTAGSESAGLNCWTCRNTSFSPEQVGASRESLAVIAFAGFARIFRTRRTWSLSPEKVRLRK